MKQCVATILRFWNRRFGAGLASLLACTTVAFSPASTFAADDALRVAARPNLPPYIIDGATGGIEVDLVKAVFKEAGKSIAFVQMDRVAMISQFEEEKLDGTLTQSPTATSHGCLTDWYMVHQNVGFSIRKKNIALTQLKDLANFAVVSFDNAKIFLGKSFADSVKNNQRYQEIAPQSRHINLLYDGKVDVIVGDEWIIRDIQRRFFETTGAYQELEVHQIMPPSLYSARFQKQETCDAFNAALSTLRLNGTYDAIVEAYRQKTLIRSTDRED